MQKRASSPSVTVPELLLWMTKKTSVARAMAMYEAIVSSGAKRKAEIIVSTLKPSHQPTVACRRFASTSSSV